MADLAGWRPAAESELRALGRELRVPPPGDLTQAVRQRLEGKAVASGLASGRRAGRTRRPAAWRGVVVAAVVLIAVLVATPQGRAVISHVFRFVGIEIRQQPGPLHPPSGHARMPGQRGMSLEQARRRVAFPILVPGALGRPDAVQVSGHGRVVSLIYRRTPYGTVRMDEFAGHLDRLIFEKFVHVGAVTQVTVRGREGLWIKGPQELIYITRKGTPASASARLTTGNTLIWGTRLVALRLEGSFAKAAALAIADSAR